MRKRKQLGRPQAAKERPIAPTKAPSKDMTDDYRARQGSRASIEPDPRYPAPNALTRASVDNVPLASRQPPGVLPSPRPASAQPTSTDPRRPSNVSQQYAASQPGYLQATETYTRTVNMPQAQYSSYDSPMSYDTAPPPYQSDNKRVGGGGSQPSTTGSQGFSSMYATSGGPPRPNQGQRRHDGR